MSTPVLANRSTPHRAAVMTPGRVFYGDGTTAELRPGLITDVGAILAGTFRMAPDVCVVVDGPQLDELRAAELGTWKFSELRAWTTFEHKPTGRTVSIGVRAAMDPKRQHHVLFGAHTEPGVLAMLLDRYQEVTGCAWRGTPAMSSLAIMRSTWGNPAHQPLWHHVEKGAGHVGPLIWSRELNEWEASWGYVHTFDANAAYLGAAGNADLAWGPLQHTGPKSYDGKPGYWLITPDLRGWPADGRPPLFTTVGRTGRVCVTSPYLRLLDELGITYAVHDTWTAERGSRILRPWAERLRDARAAVDGWPAGGLRDAVLRAVKRTYTDATGAMQRVRKSDGGGMRVQRPDWAHTLIDLWRATLVRKMIRVRAAEGVWPVAVNVDALSYADSVDELGSLAATLGVGKRGLGGWKHADVTDSAAWADAHPVRPVRARSRSGVS